MTKGFETFRGRGLGEQKTVRRNFIKMEAIPKIYKIINKNSGIIKISE